jgi:uncharacterized protein
MIFIDAIFAYELNLWQWGAVLLCSMLIGAIKSGLAGAGLMYVPILASIFGGKPSTGFILPILLMADIFAVIYYNRHANWSYLVRLLPWTIAGVFIGVFVGHSLNSTQFNNLLAGMIIIGVALMLWRDFKREDLKIPNYWWFTAIMGLAGGFTTMVGNAAAPIMIIYFLSQRLPKNIFIGTGAWFYLIVSSIKLPLHIFVWKTITLQSFAFNITQLPIVLLGAFFGVKIVKLFSEKVYKTILIVTTLATAILLF